MSEVLMSEVDESHLKLLRETGSAAAAELFEQEREKLMRFVMHRMDQRLLTRIDFEDVLQEAQIVIVKRYEDWVANPAVPIFIWMRSLTGQVLIDLHRKHLHMKIRDINREVSLEKRLPFQSSANGLQQLLAASGTSPSMAAIRDEEAQRLQRALERLSDLDREILVLRHLEQLRNSEVAQILGIDKSAATKRYVRALAKLGALINQQD